MFVTTSVTPKIPSWKGAHLFFILAITHRPPEMDNPIFADLNLNQAGRLSTL